MNFNNYAEGVLLIRKMEKNMDLQFTTFSEKAKTRWKYLPTIDTSAVYYYCPYFVDDEWSEETIAKYMLDIKDLAEYCGKSEMEMNSILEGDFLYEDAKDHIWSVFSEYNSAFRNVSDKSDFLIKQKRAELAKKSYDNGNVRYITNDFVAVFVYEILCAISAGMQEVSKEQEIWNSALLPQKNIDRVLRDTWTKQYPKFLDVLMQSAEELYETAKKNACNYYDIDYDDYKNENFPEEVKIIIDKEQAKEDKIENEKQKEREIYKEKICNQINLWKEEVIKLEEDFANYKYAFWGKKAMEKAQIRSKITKLTKEINAALQNLPIPEYLYVNIYYEGCDASDLNYQTILIKQFVGSEIDNWRLIFNEASEKYELLSPDGVVKHSFDGYQNL